MKSKAKGGLKKCWPVLVVVIPLILAGGCSRTVPPAADVELEEVVSYTGEIKVILPTKEVIRLQHDDSLPELLPGATVEVERGKLAGIFAGVTVELKEGQKARLVVPALAVERIVSFTGRLKIILPTGEAVSVEPGQILPPLPLGTRSVVLSGELIAVAGGRSVELQSGQIAQIAGVEEFEAEAER